MRLIHHAVCLGFWEQLLFAVWLQLIIEERLERFPLMLHIIMSWIENPNQNLIWWVQITCSLPRNDYRGNQTGTSFRLGLFQGPHIYNQFLMSASLIRFYLFYRIISRSTLIICHRIGDLFKIVIVIKIALTKVQKLVSLIRHCWRNVFSNVVSFFYWFLSTKL